MFSSAAAPFCADFGADFLLFDADFLLFGADFWGGFWLLVISTLFEISADFIKFVPVIAVNEVGHCFCCAGLLSVDWLKGGKFMFIGILKVLEAICGKL